MSEFKVEVVDSVPAPPKARVEAESPRESFERKRDYLDGFLAQKPPQLDGGESGGDLYEDVIAALKDIYDPEIPVNIYDLGLIYGVEIDEGHVTVNMTLTTPNCPVAESMPAEVELRAQAVGGDVGHGADHGRGAERRRDPVARCGDPRVALHRLPILECHRDRDGERGIRVALRSSGP